jgi:D-3-phosphoglycerate dehydrogenase
VEVRYNNIKSNYNNLISLKVITDSKTFQLDGSIFNDMKPRLVNVLGRKMEVTPKGTMLFIENIDVPGVIGKVGKTLGDKNINIAAYLLNRNNQDGKAFAVVRVDNEVNNEDMVALEQLEEVEWIECVNINT